MKYLRWGAIVAVFVGLFLVYSYAPLTNLVSHGEYAPRSLKFDTPDETINYFFATNVAKTDALAYSESLNATFTNPIIFMRWMQSPGVGSSLLFPGTFVGFIIFAGVVAKLFGASAILFLTPLLAVGSVVCMYSLVRQIFSKNVAVWSAIILAMLPPFFYYSSRTMFHTVPFIFFLLFGIATYLRAREEKYSWLFLFLSALGFSGALFIRFADIWWVGLIMLALLFASRIGVKKSVAFCFLVVAMSSTTLILNHALYGNFFTFGYPIPGFSASSATTAAARIGRFVLPFGFYPRFIWPAFVQALWQPYSGFIVLSMLGFAAMAIRYWQSHRRTVLVSVASLFAISLYCLALYGSWSFSDSPTPGLVTIGSSYTRYFLPLLVLLVPCAGYLIANGIYFLKKESMRVFASIFMIVLFGAWSWSLAYAGDEGLLHNVSQVASYDAITVGLENQGAKPEDIFLVRRGEDKILFPDFPRVINVDYLPKEMVQKNVENFTGTVWVSEGNHVFKKENPYKK